MADMTEKGTPDRRRASNPVDAATQDWFLRLSSGEATADDHLRFEAWRLEDPRHAQAYVELQSLWSDIDDLRPVFASADPLLAERSKAPRARLAEQGIRENVFSIQRLLTGRAWFARTWAGLAAACLALFLFAGPQIAENIAADYATVVGGQTRVELPDGSIAWLNTDTAIDVQYTNGRREIRLLRGEAQFEVVKDPAHPFSVLAARGRSTALGTVYSVQLEGKGVVVSVSEGRVEVRSPQKASTSSDDEGSCAVLTAGEALSYVEGAPPGVVGSALRRDTAWRNGFIAIENLSLVAAFEEIDRYHPGKIVLLVDVSNAKPVTARLAIKNLDDGLDALATAQGLSLTRVSDYLVFVR